MKRFLSIFLFFACYTAGANCDSWDLSIINKSPSNCPASGEFAVRLTNAGSLTDIMYEIENTEIGLTISQSNNIFSNLPKGTYTITVHAKCENNITSKTTTTIVDGINYTEPAISKLSAYPNPCLSANYGHLYIVLSGQAPFTAHLTNTTISKTSIHTLQNYNYIYDIHSGNYSVKIVDNCGTETLPQYFTIEDKPFALRNEVVINYTNEATSCNKFYFKGIYITNFIEYGPFFPKESEGIKNMEYCITLPNSPPAYKPVFDVNTESYVDMEITLPGSIKDYYFYKKTSYLEAHVKFCGKEYKTKFYLRGHSIYDLDITQQTTCTGAILNGNPNEYSYPYICFPYKLEIINKATSRVVETLDLPNYESFKHFSTGDIQYGEYTIKGTTGDSFVDSITLKIEEKASPYTVSLPALSAENGMVNEKRYQIHLRSLKGKSENLTIEFIDAPAGYAYKRENAVINSIYRIVGNDNASGVNDITYHWAVGQYKIKITENNCNKFYILDLEIKDSDINVFSDLDLSDIRLEQCGTRVYPKASKLNKPGEDTYIYLTPTYGSWDLKTVVLSGVGYIEFKYGAGNYVFAAVSDVDSWPSQHYTITQFLGEVNIKLDTIYFAGNTPLVNMSESQGFLCLNANDNEGQLYVQAKGGFPPYTYSLYASKADAIAGVNLMYSNTDGGFSSSQGLSLQKHLNYTVKMTDNCGYSSLQEFTIADLTTIQITQPNKIFFLGGDTLKFTTVVLPKATYNWTGPNGFLSTLQNPVIPNLTKENEGEYFVKIKSMYCGTENTHSIRIIVRDVPLMLIDSCSFAPYIWFDADVSDMQWEYASADPTVESNWANIVGATTREFKINENSSEGYYRLSYTHEGTALHSEYRNLKLKKTQIRGSIWYVTNLIK